MAKSKLSLNPHHTKAGGAKWWFYEDTAGIDVLFDPIAPSQSGVAVQSFRIPIASIRAYMRRLEAADE